MLEVLEYSASEESQQLMNNAAGILVNRCTQHAFTLSHRITEA
jgi:hypothetical protein